MPTDLLDYKKLYLQTAKEYLEKISSSLNQLSGNSADKEALNNLHIASHSLKSQSQVMNYNDVAEISKSLEEISNNALLTDIPLTGDVVANAKKSAEELNKILKQVQDDTGK